MKRFFSVSVTLLFAASFCLSQGHKYPPGTNVWYGDVAMPTIAPLSVQCVTMDQYGMLATQACGSGTLTPSPQFQMPYYDQAGTQGHIKGATAIKTDGAGNLFFPTSAVTEFPSLSGDAGAAINTAFTTNNVVVVSTANSPNATSIITIPNAATGLNGIQGMLEVRGSGIFTVKQILAQDSTTANVQSGTLWCPDGATIKLANGANNVLISDTNFSNLTGSTNPYGALGFRILNCKIDGNKTNQTLAGWAIQLYGRQISLQNITEMNAYSGGAWLEQYDTGSFSGPDDDDLQVSAHDKFINNDGDGLYIPQGQLWSFTDTESWGNSGWGIKVKGQAQFQTLNTFLNTSGGCDIQSGGAIIGSNVICTSANGWGFLAESGAGSDILTSSQFGCNGCIGLELRSSEQKISGQVANSSTGIKFNGGGGIINLVGFGNTTVFNCASFSGVPIVSFYGLDAGQTLFDNATCGSYPQTGYWTWSNAGIFGINWHSQTLHAGGYTYTLPNANGTIALTSNLPLSAVTGSIGGSALGVNACTNGTVTVTGATTNMVALVSPTTDPNSGTTQNYDWYALVTSAGTVTVYECALVAGTPTATTFNVRVIQ